jgi:RNA polymerase sigma-70 factor (ECF subfamily)
MHFRKDSKNRTVNIESEQIASLFEELEEDYYSEEKEKLVKILAALDDERLSIIEMRFFEKLSFKEISEIMGITENNAKVKLYRTLDKLKKNFNTRA